MHHIFLDIATLTVVGFFAGFIDAIAGGGGLIQVPALLSVGLSPATAFGTNKLVGAVGELSAIYQYAKSSRLDFKRIKIGIVCILISASIGAILVQLIHASILEKLIPFLVLLVLVYLCLPHQNKPKIRMKEKTFFIAIGSLIAFYNGFFGPATGTMWTAALMFFIGFSLRDAIMYTKPLNFAGNIISVFWFVLGGHINYLIAVFMAVGTFTGGRAGARFVVHKEMKLIRPLFIVIVSLITVGLFLKYY